MKLAKRSDLSRSASFCPIAIEKMAEISYYLIKGKSQASIPKITKLTKITQITLKIVFLVEDFIQF